MVEPRSTPSAARGWRRPSPVTGARQTPHSLPHDSPGGLYQLFALQTAAGFHGTPARSAPPTGHPLSLTAHAVILLACFSATFSTAKEFRCSVPKTRFCVYLRYSVSLKCLLSLFRTSQQSLPVFPISYFSRIFRVGQLPETTSGSRGSGHARTSLA